MVEVSDTSLTHDLKVKLPLYARAGIPIYWVVEIPKRTIHEYRDPDSIGRRYRLLHSVSQGALTSTLAGTKVEVATADLFRF